MMRLTRKNFISAMIGLVAVGFGLAGGTTFFLLKAIESASSRFTETQKRTAGFEQSLHHLRSEKQNLEEFESEIVKFRNRFLNLSDPRAVTVFLHEMQLAGTEEGVQFDGQLGSAAQDGTTIGLSIHTRGSLNKVLAVLWRFEHFPYLLRVETISMSRIEAYGSGGQEGTGNTQAGDVAMSAHFAVALSR